MTSTSGKAELVMKGVCEDGTVDSGGLRRTGPVRLWLGKVFSVGQGTKAFYFSEICNITTSRKIVSSNEQDNSNNNHSVLF